jgi:hypothetical protein
MAIIGWYYLHTDGSLIYKRDTDSGIVADLRESDFVRAIWPLDATNREGAWDVLVEALAFGAALGRIKQLAQKWGCTDEDALVYADRIGCTLVNTEGRWHACRAVPDGYVVDSQSLPTGIGPTALEAMAMLAVALKLHPSKMWGVHFKDLLKCVPVKKVKVVTEAEVKARDVSDASGTEPKACS